MRLGGRPAFGRRRRVLVTVAALVCIAILGGARVAVPLLDRPLTDFTREPQNALGGDFYVGFVAVLAMLIWWSAATIALFTAGIARSERREFLVLGIVLVFLVLDDGFQLHEHVLPDRIGISERIVYGVYVLGFLALLVAGRRFVARHDARLFAAAVVFLATSVASDVVEQFIHVQSRLLEEGSKLLGIALLVLFTAGAAADALTPPRLRPDRPRRAPGDEAPSPGPSPASSRESAAPG